MLTFVLLACLVKVAFVAPATSDKSSTPEPAAALQGVQFESCDKKSSFQLLDKEKCIIDSPRVHTQCHYTIVDASWPTLTGLVPGYLKRDELWYIVNQSGMLDPDKTLLYQAQAPEHVIVKQMWRYADLAQKYFEQNHSYPAEGNRWKSLDSNFHFLNPFTLQQDAAALVAPREIHSDPTWSVRPSNMRAYPHWRPGGICCVCIDGTKFFVHGCGRDGRPLTASDAARFFVIECQNGKELTTRELQKSEGQKLDNQLSNSGRKEMRVFVCSSSEQAAAIANFRSLCCALVWLGAILSSLWCLSAFRMKQSLKHKILSVLVLFATWGALAAWYFLALTG